MRLNPITYDHNILVSCFFCIKDLKKALKKQVQESNILHLLD